MISGMKLANIACTRTLCMHSETYFTKLPYICTCVTVRNSEFYRQFQRKFSEHQTFNRIQTSFLPPPKAPTIATSERGAAVLTNGLKTHIYIGYVNETNQYVIGGINVRYKTVQCTENRNVRIQTITS